MEIRATTAPDRPSWAALAAVIGLGMLGGLGLARTAASAPVPAGGSPPAEPELPPEEPSSAASTADEPGVAPAPEEPPPPAAPPEVEAARGTPATAPADVPRSWSRVVHGRIAYLRCVAAPTEDGIPASCPRDPVLEAAVWAAIDGIVACPSAPAAIGEADLVVEVAAGVPPEVRTRDRFAPEVVRLDAAAVAGCLAPALATLTSSAGVARVVVSFRFRLE